MEVIVKVECKYSTNHLASGHSINSTSCIPIFVNQRPRSRGQRVINK
jgi:hypothetical protein